MKTPATSAASALVPAYGTATAIARWQSASKAKSHSGASNGNTFPSRNASGPVNRMGPNGHPVNAVSSTIPPKTTNAIPAKSLARPRPPVPTNSKYATIASSSTHPTSHQAGDPASPEKTNTPPSKVHAAANPVSARVMVSAAPRADERPAA